MYGVNSFATLMMNSKNWPQQLWKLHIELLLTNIAADEFKNDPRNPNAKTVKPADKH